MYIDVECVVFSYYIFFNQFSFFQIKIKVKEKNMNCERKARDVSVHDKLHAYRLTLKIDI